MKHFLDGWEKFGKLGNGIATIVGWLTIAIFLLSLYPPLSFTVKYLLLVIFTH